ncbi:MAG: AEC family transporter [Clostridia bacterium]|nr:AEC family transporter [Clostridia bacterium]
MEVFRLTVSQMLVIFLFIFVGYLLRRYNVVEKNAYANLSKMEMFVFMPALNLYTQMTKCTVKNFKENAPLILYGGVIIIVAILIASFLSRFLVRNYKENKEAEYQRNIYKYAIAFANYGFFGNFLVLSVFGDDMLFKYSMFCQILNIFTYAWGMYVLIPKDRNAGIMRNLIRGVTSVPMLAIYLGMILGLTGVGDKILEVMFINTVLKNASDCMGPIAMLLAGMVLGNYPLGDLFKEKRVYIVSLLRLILIPAFFVVVLKLIGSNDIVIMLTLIAFAAPLGLNTIVYPAAYGGDTKTGASMALISSLFAVATLPIMYYIFIQLW